MPARPNHVTLAPAQGGQLVTIGSPTAVGAGNYRRKVNFRRVDEHEQAREGWFFFDPASVNPLDPINPLAAIPKSPVIQTATLGPGSRSNSNGTFIGQATFTTISSNATHTTFSITGGTGTWNGGSVPVGIRFYSPTGGTFTCISGQTVAIPKGHTYTVTVYWLEGGSFIDMFINDWTGSTALRLLDFEPDSGASPGDPVTFIGECVRPNLQRRLVVATKTDIFGWDTNTSTWFVLASGFTDDERARRWQSALLNGFLILNNGYDLPVTIRAEELTAEPIKELREIGIARVGFIVENNGYLTCYDITYVKADQLAGILNGPSPFAAITDEAKVERVAYDAIWGEYAQPRRWAPLISVTLNSATAAITLPYPMSGWTVGTKMAVINGGENGGTHGGQEAYPDGVPISTVVGNVITLAAPTNGALTYPRTVQVTRFSDISTLSGKASIQDDSSEIVAVAPFNGRTLIYRKTGIFRATYLGLASKPFDFKPVYRGPNVPIWRDAIADVEGKYHLYPGSGNRFYYFDGVNEPEIHAPTDNARTVLFGPDGQYGPGTVGPNSDIYAVNNTLTKEYWFINANGSDWDPVMAFDYIKNTVSEMMVGHRIKAAAAIRRPVPEHPDDWFVFYVDTGGIEPSGLRTYGLAFGGDGFRTYLRDGTRNYMLMIEGGFDAWRDYHNEKDIVGYVAHIKAGAPGGQLPVIEVEVAAARDELEVEEDWPATVQQSLYGPYRFDLYERGIFLADRLSFTFPATINGNPLFEEEYLKDIDIRFLGRTWEIAKARTSSTPRGANVASP